VKSQNVTISLPIPLLRQAKALAAKRGTSVSAMLRAALAREVEAGQDYARAMAEALEDLEQGFALGTGGRATWTRDELHERR